MPSEPGSYFTAFSAKEASALPCIPGCCPSEFPGNRHPSPRQANTEDKETLLWRSNYLRRPFFHATDHRWWLTGHGTYTI